MPTSVEIDVLAPRFIEIPEHRLHAIACNLVEGSSSERHSGRHRSQDKPWTVWPFRVVELPGVPGGSVALRLRVNWLPDTPPPDRLTHSMPSTLQLGSYRCRVMGKAYRLAEYGRLIHSPLATVSALAYHRPTYFRRNGTDVIDPDPYLLFNSLARKWNIHCPKALRLDPEDVQELQDAATLMVVEGAVQRVVERGRGVHEGFVGEVVVQTTAQQRAFSALLTAAEFLGVGAGTTRGYGVVEARMVGP